MYVLHLHIFLRFVLRWAKVVCYGPLASLQVIFVCLLRCQDWERLRACERKSARACVLVCVCVCDPWIVPRNSVACASKTALSFFFPSKMCDFSLIRNNRVKDNNFADNQNQIFDTVNRMDSPFKTIWVFTFFMKYKNDCISLILAFHFELPIISFQFCCDQVVIHKWRHTNFNILTIMVWLLTQSFKAYRTPCCHKTLYSLCPVFSLLCSENWLSRWRPK